MAELQVQWLPAPQTSLEDLIRCSQCLKEFSQPKTLSCQHTFCLSCLENLSTNFSLSVDKTEMQMTCPECKEMTLIPENRLERLPTSFAIENLMEIEKVFKETEIIAKQTSPSMPKEKNTAQSLDKQENKGSNFPKQDKSRHLPGLKYPWGIGKAKTGEIIVAEWGKDQISVLDSNGRRQLAFGANNKKGHKFTNPRCVAIHKGDHLLVTSSHCLQVYSMDGSLVATIGAQGDGELEFDSPAGVAVHPANGQIYIADSNNHRIQVLNKDFTFSYFVGSKGTSKGELSFPWDVAIDSNGLLYVADGNSRIQKFTPEGAYVDSFGTQGSKPGEMSRPSSLAIDKRDQVYVTELHNNRVSLYESDGGFIRTYGGKDGGYSLSGPCGVAVDDEKNELYVTDCWNDRIVVFKT